MSILLVVRRTQSGTRRIENDTRTIGGYVTALVSGVAIGMSWWIFPMVVCHALAGLIGFNWGDRWAGSMWMRWIGYKANGKV